MRSNHAFNLIEVRAVRISLVVIAVGCLQLGWGSILNAQSPERVTRDLLTLYQFDKDQAGVVADLSGGGDLLDVRIDKPQLAKFRAGRMEFSSSLIVASDGPATKISTAIKRSNELTIEAWLTPQDKRQQGPARIVSLSLNPSERNFTLGQEAGHFEVRLRTTSTDDNGNPATKSPEDSVSRKLTHVVFTRNTDGAVVIYIDGKTAVTNQVEGTLDNWNENFRLTIGNEATGDRPWQGGLHLVAIFASALTAAEVQQNFNAGAPTGLDYASLLPPADLERIEFVKHIQPILREHCYDCHSEDQEDGGVNLGIRQRAMQGGHNGPIMDIGHSADSRLIQVIAAIENDIVMPPDSDGLSRQQIAVMRAWIDQGATWPEGTDIPSPRAEQAKTHWAFQPLRKIAEPIVHEQPWPQTGIDRFILARLEAESLMPSGQANARQLIRRITFDLIGLPPTPADVDEFCVAVERDRDAAIEAVIDRLLQSPQYGERWGRHWLDLARYADSDGQESDSDRPNAYHYRDFVIRALNADMPYDQFIRWQLAGDEYEPTNPQAIAATGFIAAGPFAALPDNLMQDEQLRNRYNELDDIISTVGTGFLGLTLGCVRCHDHKYDAIPARDYYRLMSAFHGGERAEVSLGDTQETTLAYRDLDAEPAKSWLFQRGNYYDRDQPVTLGFVSILTNGKTPESYWQDARQQGPNKQSSNQRRAIGDWITDVDHGAGALLARVIVNRIWQHHFGQGIVRTMGDFGTRSESPTHPDLLEWLANDLVENGWQMKRMHRLIMLSAVYQQSSSGSNPSQDRENRLLSKMPLLRLEGEVLRDSMLAVNGTLNLASYGPAVKPAIVSEAMQARNLKDSYPDNIPDGPELRRRSVYLFHKRVVPYPLLQAFDKPDAQQSCSRRDHTTVAPQALALMNDPFVRTSSLEFADRLINEAADAAGRIERGYQLALSRSPGNDERESALRFVNEQMKQRQQRDTESEDGEIQRRALADFCQVLFSLNEFLYVD